MQRFSLIPSTTTCSPISVRCAANNLVTKTRKIRKVFYSPIRQLTGIWVVSFWLESITLSHTFVHTLVSARKWTARSCGNSVYHLNQPPNSWPRLQSPLLILRGSCCVWWALSSCCFRGLLCLSVSWLWCVSVWMELFEVTSLEYISLLDVYTGIFHRIWEVSTLFLQIFSSVAFRSPLL